MLFQIVSKAVNLMSRNKTLVKEKPQNLGNLKCIRSEVFMAVNPLYDHIVGVPDS
jgi:hypothetical protein